MAGLEVRVALPTNAYTVHVGAGLVRSVGQVVPPTRPGLRAGVVTDDNTGPLFGEAVEEAVAASGWEPVRAQVPAGEGSKSLEEAGRLLGLFAEARLDRSSVVFAVGGGVVGDLAGFVAATYMRGIGFVTVPTSLLAQVDSSVGGKVAVDLPQGKNLAGAFHQPLAVVIDPEALSTLPVPQLQAGLAEVVKHAAIADAEMFGELERAGGSVLNYTPDRWAALVARNCAIKASVVSEDPEERRGLRATLNYGHTVGHAVEVTAGNWGLLHGQAVAIGMVAEARAAGRLGLAAPEVAERLLDVLSAIGLPTDVPRGSIDLEQAVRALRTDKKVAGGEITLPVVSRIGQVGVRTDVGLRELEAALAGVLV